MLQMCVSPDDVSRSSSEPVQSTLQPTHPPDHMRTADRCRKGENALEQDQTNTDHAGDFDADTHTNDDAHTQRSLVVRETVVEDTIQEQVSVENETYDQMLENEELDEKRDTSMELIEIEENTDTSR